MSKFIYLKLIRTGRSKGGAFVKFETEEGM